MILTSTLLLTCSTLMAAYGPSWPHLGPVYNPLGASLEPPWGRLGTILGPFGPPWGGPGAPREHPRSCLAVELVSLEHLGIGAAARLTDAGLQELAGLPRLRRLSAHRLQRISVRGLIQLCLSAPALKQVDAEGCEYTPSPGPEDLEALRRCLSERPYYCHEADDESEDEEAEKDRLEKDREKAEKEKQRREKKENAQSKSGEKQRREKKERRS